MTITVPEAKQPFRESTTAIFDRLDEWADLPAPRSVTLRISLTYNDLTAGLHFDTLADVFTWASRAGVEPSVYSPSAADDTVQASANFTLALSDGRTVTVSVMASQPCASVRHEHGACVEQARELVQA